jgi:hypothetical protein
MITIYTEGPRGSGRMTMNVMMMMMMMKEDDRCEMKRVTYDDG